MKKLLTVLLVSGVCYYNNVLFEVVVALSVVGFCYFYKICTCNYGVLEAMGIPVAKPFFCFGSGPYKLHAIDVARYDRDQVKQFSPSKSWGKCISKEGFAMSHIGHFLIFTHFMHWFVCMVRG